jgi:hypothetical protein
MFQDAISAKVKQEADLNLISRIRLLDKKLKSYFGKTIW